MTSAGESDLGDERRAAADNRRMTDRTEKEDEQEEDEEGKEG